MSDPASNTNLNARIQHAAYKELYATLTATPLRMQPLGNQWIYATLTATPASCLLLKTSELQPKTGPDEFFDHTWKLAIACGVGT